MDYQLQNCQNVLSLLHLRDMVCNLLGLQQHGGGRTTVRKKKAAPKKKNVK
jgi:hypothetical protein